MVPGKQDTVSLQQGLWYPMSTNWDRTSLAEAAKDSKGSLEQQGTTQCAMLCRHLQESLHPTL